LKLNGYFATDQEVQAIIRRLDIDADQQINFSEFVDAFKPLQTSLAETQSSFPKYSQEEEKR
jgi:Ca2+-binding EF-hand superfamily protein